MTPAMIESFFQRSLEELVKGLRAQMIGESAYLSKALDEVRKEIKSMDLSTKTVALQKLTYLNMLQGTDMGWAAFHVVEVMSTQKFSLKKLGYLAASQSFNEGTDVLLLITNLLRKDLGGKNEYETSLAIECLSRIGTSDLTRDLTPELFIMLASSRSFVRKKATVALLRVFTQYPDSIRVIFRRLIERLNDTDPSVVTAAVSVLCDLAVKDPKPYLPLAPELCKLLVRSPNNWLCIKLVKLLGVLAPLEPRLGKKIVDPLCELIRQSEAKSLLMECIQTVTSGLTDHPGAVNLCVEKLKDLLVEDDTNLKYLCLRALANLMPLHPWAVAENKEVIVKCLNHRDSSIQNCALRLIIGMVSKSNVMETVHVLLRYAYNTDTFSCNELVEVILSTCSSYHYGLISDFSWYVSVLAEMARIPHCECGDEIGRQLIDIGFRVKSATADVLKAGRDLLLDAALLDRISVQGVLSAVAWIAGEYVAFSPDLYDLVEALLQPRTVFLPGSIRALYVQAVFKVFVYAASKSFSKTLSSSSCNIGEGNYSEKLSSHHYMSTAEYSWMNSPKEVELKPSGNAYPGDTTNRSIIGGEGKFINDRLKPEDNISKGCMGDSSNEQYVQELNDWHHESAENYGEDSIRNTLSDVPEKGFFRDEKGVEGSLEPMINLVAEKVTPMVTSLDVEVQERACHLLGLLKVVKDVCVSSFPRERDFGKVVESGELLDALLGILAVELRPVSIHAQGRVAPVAGLTLENLDDLGPMHNREAVEGLIGVGEVPEWHIDGMSLWSQSKGSTLQVGESSALLAQHRQRHQNFYLPAEEKSVSNSSGYPPPLMAHRGPVENFHTPSTEPVPLGADLSWRTKPSRVKARPVVVKLDDDDDHLKSSLKLKKKDLKDEFISGAIMDVLAGHARSVDKNQTSTQWREGSQPARIRSHRSRASRSSRSSGKDNNNQTSPVTKEESTLAREVGLTSETERNLSNVSQSVENIKSTSRHNHSRHEKKSLSSRAHDQEPGDRKLPQASPPRKGNRQRSGRHRAISPMARLNSTSSFPDD